MANTPEQDTAARAAIEYGITIFRALRAQTQNITEAMLSVSALLQNHGR